MKKRLLNLLYWLVLASAALYFAYAKGWILASFDSLTPAQAYSMMQKDHTLTLLDVRTPEEYAQGHIPGATLIPVQTLGENLSLLNHVRNAKIIVYCQSGMRSVKASRILQKNGFTPLNVTGGMNAWESAGLPVVH